MFVENPHVLTSSNPTKNVYQTSGAVQVTSSSSASDCVMMFRRPKEVHSFSTKGTLVSVASWPFISSNRMIHLDTSHRSFLQISQKTMTFSHILESLSKRKNHWTKLIALSGKRNILKIHDKMLHKTKIIIAISNKLYNLSFLCRLFPQDIGLRFRWKPQEGAWQLANGEVTRWLVCFCTRNKHIMSYIYI